MSVRVLLCDDSGVILVMFEKRLTDLGFTVVGKAKDGNDAIRQYKSLKPDLLLLDITMPNKDGREALEEIIQFDPNAKVVMISAIFDEEIQKGCINCGAKGFLVKCDISTKADFDFKVMQVLEPLVKAA